MSINVIDVNDDIPKFAEDSYTVNVHENITQGSIILNLRVNDRDTNENHVFSIYTSGSPRTLDKFEIESWSGTLRLKEPLDHEITKQHVLIVEVADSRISTAGVSSARALTRSFESGRTTPTLTPFAASSHRSFAKIVINVLDGKLFVICPVCLRS